ncbi:Cyanovirin-N -like protein [Ceratocystis fimbriata CBS 114723]|uniref:Cyanovirin-N-like protein n=1 Tax=Ceratocystis fimbriata CBS 114723 TaxID=1035309 RepID=A0A2C5X3N8_9PEZI|nr:Cyanovirin-N -like protein [Ceratocystis fimbriata CBS 114723]
MSFHQSAEDIELHDGHILKARLRNGDGDLQDAEIDLDRCLANVDGRFEWGGEGFHSVAEDISFSIEGDDNVPILRAALFNCEGEPVRADVNLSERIHNENGNFEFR